MAAMVRPSLILQMDLDERAHSDEVVAEIKRSYSYVAPATVTTHAPGEGPVQNVMRFRVRLHKPYWDKRDPDAEALWSGVMPAWLRNMLRKVSSTVVASNNAHREQGKELAYDWIELEFGDRALVAVKTKADSSIPEAAVGWVERVRDLMNEGAFGDEAVACVRIPSRASWERQRAEAVEAAREAAVAGGGDAPDAGGEAASPEAAALPFDVDYAVWGVELADGAVREFDSTTASFLS